MEAGSNIAGSQGAELVARIRGVAPDRCLAVGVDVAKASWHLLIANFLGEVVVAGVDIVADEAGYAELRKRIDAAAATAEAQVLRVGVESAGHYHETLAGRLMADGYEVVGHNPAAVKKARGEAGKSRTKTDGLDAAAMCSLTIRGLGRRPYLPADAVGELQVAYLGREALASHRSALRNQITSLLDLIWPGATAEDKALGVRPILSDILSPTGVALLRLGPDPRRIGADSPAVLARRLRARGANPTRTKCAELVARARMALAPSGPVEARIALLQRFLDIFEALDAAIAAIEAEEAAALGMTKGAKLPEVVGLGVVSVAGYVAFVGDPARFDNRPERIWRALGADPARAQSGSQDPDLPISREGSAWGRAAMMKAGFCLTSHNPVFARYLAGRRDEKKPGKVARMAAANKANRLLCHLMATGQTYDLEAHQRAVEKARTAGASKQA
jgi:transposase